jgi:hypothetical protein
MRLNWAYVVERAKKSNPHDQLGGLGLGTARPALTTAIAVALTGAQRARPGGDRQGLVQHS